MQSQGMIDPVCFPVVKGVSPKTVGVLGLGLIGGSIARAYHKAGWRVLAHDTHADTLILATLDGVCQPLESANIAECDLIILAIYPGGCIDWLRANAADVKPGTLVIDCCGVKRPVCADCDAIAREHGFTFVGGHPMAGTQYSGYAHSRADLFVGAPMVIVPPRTDDMALLDRVATMLAPCRFGSIMVTTAEEHDRRIAYTSQLAHVVSNAYIKSPSAQGHDGFSAGSYRDMTRVAWLNETMWCELFLDDADFLGAELDLIIANLQEYRDALASRDADRLRALLREGRLAKESAEAGIEGASDDV